MEIPLSLSTGLVVRRSRARLAGSDVARAQKSATRRNNLSSIVVLYTEKRGENTFHIFKKRNVLKAPDGNERQGNTDEVMRL